MGLSEGIRRVGFRRWYERQLIESHLFFITGLLCLIAVMACIEGFSLSLPMWESVLRAFTIAAGSIVCLWAIHRYLLMLGIAQHAAARSVCRKCETYGRLEVSSHAHPGGGPDAQFTLDPVGVRCRKCGHEWTIA